MTALKWPGSALLYQNRSVTKLERFSHFEPIMTKHEVVQQLDWTMNLRASKGRLLYFNELPPTPRSAEAMLLPFIVHCLRSI